MTHDMTHESEDQTSRSRMKELYEPGQPYTVAVFPIAPLSVLLRIGEWCRRTSGRFAVRTPMNSTTSQHKNRNDSGYAAGPTSSICHVRSDWFLQSAPLESVLHSI